MHGTVIRFISGVKVKYPGMFAGTVLEMGSRNVNGSPRQFFNATEYVGVDSRPGKDVDVVSYAHEYVGPDGYFDTVISTEMLEHDKYWELSIKAMMAKLKQGGCLLITCAGEDRPEHRKAETGHYKNLSLYEVGNTVAKYGRFKETITESNGLDTRFAGICRV